MAVIPRIVAPFIRAPHRIQRKDFRLLFRRDSTEWFLPIRETSVTATAVIGLLTFSAVVNVGTKMVQYPS